MLERNGVIHGRAKCDAVLFSHYHGDHVGLLYAIPDKDVCERDIKFGMGTVARKVLINIHIKLVTNGLLALEEREK